MTCSRNKKVMTRKFTLCVMLLLTLTTNLPAMATPDVEVGFSPDGSALQLVLNTINTSKQSIRLMGYSFTSPEIVKALIAAKLRGVDVQLVLDEKGNRNKAGQAAMNILVNAGIPLRINSRYAIMHDKVIIVDGETVETGSFNYTRAAARKNSENVLVIHEAPLLAMTYLRHWQTRWNEGQDYSPTY